MKKYLSIVLVIIMTALFIGCTSKTEASEIDSPKTEYNIAYLKIPFYNQGQENTDAAQSIINHDSNFWSNSNYAYCHITDWYYSRNDTIVLYLKDGRKLQTHTENVLLMYDPDLE